MMNYGIRVLDIPICALYVMYSIFLHVLSGCLSMSDSTLQLFFYFTCLQLENPQNRQKSCSQQEQKKDRKNITTAKTQNPRQQARASPLKALLSKDKKSLTKTYCMHDK